MLFRSRRPRSRDFTEAVNLKTKRLFASWLLLAVFVPMVVLSSLHVHEAETVSRDNCKECVAHHHHGHLGELTTTIHACVICQFQTFSFVSAVIFTFIVYNKVSVVSFALRQSDFSIDVCGIPTLRAPPQKWHYDA